MGLKRIIPTHLIKCILLWGYPLTSLTLLDASARRGHTLFADLLTSLLHTCHRHLMYHLFVRVFIVLKKEHYYMSAHIDTFANEC